jgi:hypothetical protein
VEFLTEANEGNEGWRGEGGNKPQRHREGSFFTEVNEGLRSLLNVEI